MKFCHPLDETPLKTVATIPFLKFQRALRENIDFRAVAPITTYM